MSESTKPDSNSSTAMIPTVGPTGQGVMRLSEFLPGDANSGLREMAVSTGEIPTKVKGRSLAVRTRPIAGTEDHEIIAVAAVVRDPGTSQAYIDAVADFLPTVGKSKYAESRQFWQMYLTEGMLNNAINKIAAILSTGGRFTVRRAKKGKQRKAQDTLQAILDEFVTNVNNAPMDGVVTGSRGLKSLTQQAVRQALVEGDWFGRTVWSKHQVGTFGAFDMPMTIQSISVQFIQPVKEVAGTGIEAFYWTPDSTLLNQIQKPSNKDVADMIKKFVQDKDILGQLKKNRKALLDPALLCHIKHRGVDMNPFGESFIKPALQAISFKRSVEALDFVTIESLVNRLCIVQVGAGGKDSKYSDPDFAAQRAALMNQLLGDPSPNMMIVWQGDDIKVTDVGAHASLLNSDSRHAIAENKVKQALGVPDALLSGSTTDGKAAGWAATIGASAELEELQNAFAITFTTIGERIAFENGFEDVDLIFQFNNSIMADKAEEWNQARLDYQAGAISATTFLSARGIDPESEFQQQCFERGLDANSALYKDAFAPLQGLPGQGTPAPGGAAPAPGQGPGKPAGEGRTPNSDLGKPQEKTQEKKSPVQSK